MQEILPARAMVMMFVFLFLQVKSNAQVQTHIGVTTTYNATFVLDQGLAKDPRYQSKFSYHWAPVGINFGVDFGKKFGLSIEALHSVQGQSYELLDMRNNISGERKIDLEYIHFPLLVRFLSRSNEGARGNFSIGPQLSLLTHAVESVTAKSGTYKLPDGVEFSSIQRDFPSAVDNNNATYSMSDQPSTELLSKEKQDFRDTELQIAIAFGLDIDLSRHLYLSTQIRGNYSLTDMRNGDLIDSIKAGTTGDIFGRRANLVAGLQLGIHYMFGTTRSFRYKR